MKRMAIEVSGSERRWLFTFDGDPKHLDEWRADGLEIIVIENTVPAWVATIGLAGPWCFLQDIFNFRNPFK